MKSLTIEDIDPSISSKVYTQNYSKKEALEGVKIIPLVSHVSEESDFSELMRFNDHGMLDVIPSFKIAQINRTRLLPGFQKAWHLHLKQNEIWYVNPLDYIFVGLWDVRRESKTRSVSMRITLGGGTSQLLFIPRGVAHGLRNFTTQSVDLFYFVDHQFNPHDPDEKRIPWDALGADFWLPQKD